jgi:hypothetical protein
LRRTRPRPTSSTPTAAGAADEIVVAARPGRGPARSSKAGTAGAYRVGNVAVPCATSRSRAHPRHRFMAPWAPLRAGRRPSRDFSRFAAIKLQLGRTPRTDDRCGRPRRHVKLAFTF